MRLIGASLGRTGTSSIADALEHLGLPCHNMKALLLTEGRASLWGDVLKGATPPDWDVLLEGYEATIAWPTCFYYEALMNHYPNAKVLLNERDEEAWFDSLKRSWGVIGGLRAFRFIPRVRALLGVVEPTLGRICGTPLDRDTAIQAYRAHNARVKATVPEARLVLCSVTDGWAPLCAALGEAIPDAPFPRSNAGDGSLKKMAKGIISGRMPKDL